MNRTEFERLKQFDNENKSLKPPFSDLGLGTQMFQEVPLESVAP